jgi:hypothetical protein
MPKFEVCVTVSRDLTFEVDAVNEEDAAKSVVESDALNPIHEGNAEQVIKWTKRKLEPQELVYHMQIVNIRGDYERLDTKQTLADGTVVDDATAETMKKHLIMLHDALVDQSGLEIPHLAQGDNLVTEHLGADVIPLKKTPVSIDNPEEVWKRCATAFGWEYDPDYKGWIKKDNRKPGKIHGEWDAYVRDLSAEDACNEEGIDTVEEAAEALA